MVIMESSPSEISVRDFDEEEEEFCSCVTEEDAWEDPGEPTENGTDDNVGKGDVKIFFKGVSTSMVGDLSTRLSGIGVVLDRAAKLLIRQKKLDFYVEEPVAEHLALMDGLLEALRNDARRVFAYTDSEIVYNQISEGKQHDDQLLSALSERIIEHSNKLEAFVLKLVPSSQLEMPLQLAQEAVGKFGSLEDCLICYEKKLQSQLVTLCCSHKFCSSCLVRHIDTELATSQVLVKCPQLGCNYCISMTDCKPFLPMASRVTLERFLTEGNIHCPYPNCSVFFNAHHCLSTRASLSSPSMPSCLECPECRRFICINCGVPWHSSVSCQEYQDMLAEERNTRHITLHHTAQNQQWRQCRLCGRMIELTQGCHHMICWCGHEFCYSCGADYRDRVQTCQCAFWDDVSFEDLDTQSTPIHDIEPWTWDSFHSLSTITEGYTEQERSNLALIQKFLAGGFDLGDHLSCDSPPRCSDTFNDTMRDLHQLPWLERFVSVISDNYEDYMQ